MAVHGKGLLCLGENLELLGLCLLCMYGYVVREFVYFNICIYIVARNPRKKGG